MMRQTSVTRVLSLVQDFSGVPEKILRRAAERGTAIHRHIQEIIDPNEWVELEPPNDEVRPYVDAWRAWMDKTGLDIGKFRAEVELKSELLGLVGHVDYLIEDGGKSHIVDAKTTAAQEVGAYRYQLAGYAMLAHVSGIEIDHAKCGLLFLGKDGSHKLVCPWADEKEMKADIAAFMNIYHTFRLKEALNERH